MRHHGMFKGVIRLVAILITGGAMAMAGEGTILDNLKQPPLNTTMMGVIKGAADYHGLDLDGPMIFGLSGHAFLINIHTELCPSGPYCWKRENAVPLLENLGLRMTDLGFFGTGTAAEDRAEVEHKLRDALDKGIPCSLLNMENQIISGYDEAGLLCAQPWPSMDITPERLTFGTWAEFGEQFHATFYTLEMVEPVDLGKAILASLDYAVDLWRNPGNHTSEAYGVGPAAYDNWVAAVPESGASHGNWWNATVWSECRHMAADYFATIGAGNPGVADLCAELRDAYVQIAENLGKASDKEMDPDAKIALLKKTKQLETAAIEKVEKLAEALRTQESRI
jgi:hypothetical protein